MCGTAYPDDLEDVGELGPRVSDDPRCERACIRVRLEDEFDNDAKLSSATYDDINPHDISATYQHVHV